MIPVIIINLGYENYLSYVLQQASKNNFVYYIGNVEPNIKSNKIKFINIDQFSNETENFQNKYTHLNTTAYNYELFCYLRWFILKKFMINNNLNTVFYIDSDVLLFVDVNEEWIKYNQYDLTLLHRTAAISSFITKDAIEKFCNMLLTIYENQDSYDFQKIKSHFDIRQKYKLFGGVCDMTLFEYFHYNSNYGGGPGRVGEMMQIINDSTYDHNINAEDQDFEILNNIKNIKIINKQPFVFNKKLNKNIKFNSIHFQGHAKQFIKSIYEKCNN